MRRRTQALLAAAAVLVVGGTYAGYRIATGGEVTEVGVDAALQRFREQVSASTVVASASAPVAPTTAIPAVPAVPAITTAPPASSAAVTATTAAPATTPPPPEPGLPQLGVYQYATEGFDRIDALGGARHDYPSITTMTVVPADCGVRLRWEVAVERWNSWDWCLDGDAVRLTDWYAYHEFFDVAADNAYVCDGDARPLVAPAGATWTTTCRMGDRTTSTFEATVVGVTTLPVAGAGVEVLHVRYEVDVAGESTGSQVIESWYRTTDGLPVRETLLTTTTQSTVVGDTAFEERYTIELLTPEPAS